MKIREQYTCPIEIISDILQGKWKMVILIQLNYFGESSLSNLESNIKGISQKMLLQHLNELIKFDLVKKEKGEGYPLKVKYSLTKDKGEKIMEALDILQKLGEEYIQENTTLLN